MSLPPLRCAGCGNVIPDGDFYKERVSDGCAYCHGCERDAAEEAAESDDRLEDAGGPHAEIIGERHVALAALARFARMVPEHAQDMARIRAEVKKMGPASLRSPVRRKAPKAGKP